MQIDRIDFLQWLFRTEPINDAIRLQKLEEARDEIDFTFQEFRKEGLVDSIGTFPYSVPFGTAVSQMLTTISGWITYFNLIEQENINNLPTDQWLIGLRPLAAGKVFSKFEQLETKTFDEFIQVPGLSKTESMIDFSLRYCLMHQQVKTNVLSINSMEQAESIKRILQHAKPIEKEKLDNILNVFAKANAEE
ncbi:MAG: hypothetical protein M3342_01310 [Bacteroidota bacterium]|nr:hypothetical protein [Bacteroidota bacterium]